MKIDWKHNKFTKIAGTYVLLLVLLNIPYFIFPYPYTDAALALEAINILNFFPALIASFLIVIVSLIRIKSLDMVDKFFLVFSIVFIMLLFSS
jgi:hypothetical protein